LLLTTLIYRLPYIPLSRGGAKRKGVNLVKSLLTVDFRNRTLVAQPHPAAQPRNPALRNQPWLKVKVIHDVFCAGLRSGPVINETSYGRFF